ncbi:hypothetical protein [Chryseobacterium gregarium]|uniref:hypothetical protein n=1 Tax=Chryseobacterium gregarium TaxID=456299 RepID=UPI000480B6FA|nr:hypothetical protein [Chryseobacterium gregarium]
MFHKIIIYSLGVVSLMNCNAQNQSATAEKTTATTGTGTAKSNPMKDEKVIYFKEGENRFLKEYQMNVTFKGISEDSRCPEGVSCIWAGTAVAQVEVMGTATRPMTLSIATTDNTGRNYSKSAEFNGYTVSLVEVNPYPKSAEGTQALKGTYQIGITITKSTGENSTTK